MSDSINNQLNIPQVLEAMDRLAQDSSFSLCPMFLRLLQLAFGIGVMRREKANSALFFFISHLE